MRFLQIFLVYIKRTFRDKMFIIIMLVFPLILIWLLGNAFSSLIGDVSPSIAHADMLYSVTDNSLNSKTFVDSLVNADIDIFTFKEEKNEDIAIDAVMKNQTDAYIVISEHTITIYKNSIYNFNGTMAELLISNYAEQYNLISTILQVDGNLLYNKSNEQPSYTKVVSIKKDREPGSMDYYGVTITSMFIFYGLIFISTYIIGDKREKTKDRILITPTHETTYQWGVIVGNVVILSCQMILMVFLGIFIFNTYWGDNLLIPLIILWAELVMVSAIGSLLGMVIKSESVVSGVAQLLIPVFVFLGDGYAQLPSTGIFGVIKQFSPIYWVNHSIFNAIYLNDYHNAWISIGISLGIAFLTTIIIIIINRVRRVAHG